MRQGERKYPTLCRKRGGEFPSRKDGRSHLFDVLKDGKKGTPEDCRPVVGKKKTRGK